MIKAWLKCLTYVDEDEKPDTGAVKPMAKWQDQQKKEDNLGYISEERSEGGEKNYERKGVH
jgi:hypothetical protein